MRFFNWFLFNGNGDMKNRVWVMGEGMEFNGLNDLVFYEFIWSGNFGVMVVGVLVLIKVVMCNIVVFRFVLFLFFLVGMLLLYLKFKDIK